MIGINHHNAKLSENDVILIRKLFAEHHRLIKEANMLTIEKIADKFDVSFSTCRDAIYRATWKHVIDDSIYGVK